MIALSKFFFLLMIISSIATDCAPGCLRCGPLQKCLFCDFQTGYFLNEGNCLQMAFTNCTDFKINGDCNLCYQGFYPDLVTKKCIKVDTPLPYCKYYDAPTICNECIEGNFVLNGKCVQIEIPISQCVMYLDQTTCLECSPGYQLQSDYKGCKIPAENRNCAIFSNFKCLACEDGFILNDNYYLDTMFSFQITNSSSVLDFLKNTKSGKGDFLAPSKCQEIKNQNCLESENANRCKTCLKGFYLNEGNCFSNPLQPISNCQTYADKNTCSFCLTGFYLENGQSCKPIVQILNCLTYHPSQPSICVECITKFFLQANLCNPRTKTIENCVTYSINQDKCSICQSDFVMTSDFLKCLPKIPNCTSYGTSSESSITLTCASCGPLNYLKSSENTCLTGTVENCELYGNSEVNCSQCTGLFYLDAGVCQKHNLTTSCISYDFKIKDLCTNCDLNHILFTNKNACKAVTPIENCISYSDYMTCTDCKEGFALKSNVCTQIDAAENCLKKNNLNGCIKCKPGYFIKGLICKLYEEYQMQNCIQIEKDGMSNNLNCHKCKAFYFPYNYLDSYVCMNTQKLVNMSIKINNCIKHKANFSTITCEDCESGYFRNAAGQCEVCSTGKKVEYQYILSPEVLDVQTASDIRRNQCLVADPLCSVSSMSVLGNEICIKCNTGQVALYEYEKTLVNPNIPLGTTVKNLGISWFGKICTTPSAEALYYPGNTVPSVNCELYEKIGDDFYCRKCIYRKTGNVLINSNNSTKPYYLNCSVDVLGCENLYHGGFHLNTNTFSKYGIDTLKDFSCHSCTNSEQVVFVSLAMNSNVFNGYELFGYDTSALKAKDALVKTGNVVSCRSVTAADLNFQQSNFNATFTQNCQMAFLDVNKDKVFTTSISKSDSPIKCVECKPNFRKLLDTNREVIGCQAIDNCDNNYPFKWINACASCNDGYSWKWDNNNEKILFDVCLDNLGDKGCLAYSDIVITGTSKNCQVCKKGYIFNKDGFCEKIIAPKCQIGGYVKSNLSFNTGNTSYNEFFLLEYLLPNGIGCVECETEYLPYYETFNETLACTQSPYLESKTLSASSNFIRYCEYYLGNDQDLTCLNCYDNYILTANSQFCLPSSNFPNCLIVNNNKTECQTCEFGFFLRKKNCYQKLIPNCQTYDSESDQMKCLICDNGFYTSTDNYSCKLGKLANCLVYDSNGKCSACKPKFGLINLSNNYVYCLEIKDNLFCQAANETLLNQQQFQCNACQDGYVINSNIAEFPKSECFKLNDISNCKTFNINSSLGTSTFRCDVCIDGYFVANDGLECQQRSKPIANCLTYNLKSEDCFICQPLFFFDNYSKFCIPFPSGIFFCKEYKSATECSVCENGYYLVSNACSPVLVDQLIPNCIEYKNNDSKLSCARCDTNFLTVDTGCTKPIARNCLTYKDSKTCDTCLPGYIFNTQADIQLTECLVYTIPNCRDVESTTKKCTLCEHGFYVNNVFKCSSVLFNIAGCLFYAGIDTCSLCQSDMYLSSNQKECIVKGRNNQNPISNCAQTFYLDNQECRVCQAGFYFKDGECEKCNLSSEQGCYACDYNDTNNCLLCISGFYQNEEYKCIKIPVNDGNEVPDIIEFIGIFNFVMMFVFYMFI